ncbi:hypothetical protein [Stenotrophomonas maltophilia]|uniref:Uncharacterized protein n=1 Tax=Stenotrophomonas maltophilia TaxID=40324 RepID=A0A2W6IU84_STEMA|nr:hypothetical protein [Stenotrophomonas maltophilia]PZS90079.1 hypothetical protein A7X83_11320 [Stenotrophomonas maltophilia]
MTLSLEELRALAAVNPFKWEGLSAGEILDRCQSAGVDVPQYFVPRPEWGTFPGSGKTVMTTAVLEHIDRVDASLSGLLRTVMEAGGERHGERLVFEVIETMAAYCSRIALESVAAVARDGAGEEVSARRVM